MGDYYEDDGYYDQDEDFYGDERYAPPQTNELLEDDEDVEKLSDALSLNKRLKEIMSSGLDPVSMQNELARLMGGMGDMNMNPSADGGGGASKPLRQSTNTNMNGGMRRPVKSKQIDQIRRPPKGANAGQTFTHQERVSMQKNNERLLNRMISIQTKRSGSIGGYQSHGKGSAVAIRSSTEINRKKKGAKISQDNQKFLQRLQNVKSTMNSKQMRSDADRQARVAALRRQVGGQAGSNNVYGKSADRKRMQKFKEKPTLTQPAWES